MRLRRDLLINLNLLFLGIIAGAVVLIIAWRVLEVVFPVLILLLAAMLLAFLLDPLVSRLQTAGFPRGLAVLTVYVVLLAAIFGLGGLFVAPLAHQLVALGSRLPADVRQLRQLLKAGDHIFATNHVPVRLESLQRQGLTYGQKLGTQLLGSTVDILLNLSHILIDVGAVIVISLYLLIDGPRLRHNILRIIPADQLNRALFVEAAVRSVVGG